MCILLCIKFLETKIYQDICDHGDEIVEFLSTNHKYIFQVDSMFCATHN